MSAAHARQGITPASQPVLSPKQLRDKFHQQQMALLLPAMEHTSGRPPKKLSAQEIAMIIELNAEIITLDRQLGRKRF